MATLADIQTALAALSGAIVTMGSSIGQIIQHLQTVQQQAINLQTQLSATQGLPAVSVSDLDQVVASISNLANECNQITDFLQSSITSKP